MFQRFPEPLGSLAAAMPTARKSLKRVAEEFVFLGD